MGNERVIPLKITVPRYSKYSLKESGDRNSSNTSDSDEYSSIEDEPQEDYKTGGYHRVNIGDIFNNRYKITTKLGWGHFSTVWDAIDLTKNSLDKHQFVAIKICKSSINFTESAKDEINILNHVNTKRTENDNEIIRLLDNFVIFGKNGNHICLVFEKLGTNFLDIMDVFDGAMPLDKVKSYVKDILKGLKFLHSKCNIIHTDLKPENILNASQQLTEVKAKIVDFGNACYTTNQIADEITTRQYRSPEIILGHSYGTAVDIWSLACIIFELFTGDFLFDPKSDSKNNYTKNQDHLALMIELLGKIPKKMRMNGRNSSNYFNKKGDLRNIQNLDFWDLNDVLVEKYLFPKKIAKELTNFLLPMLEFNPVKRITASEALKSNWLIIKDIDKGFVPKDYKENNPSYKINDKSVQNGMVEGLCSVLKDVDLEY